MPRIRLSSARGWGLEMLRISVFSLVLTALTALGTMGAGQAGVSGTLQDAITVFRQIMANPEEAIPDAILERARCIVIVPHQAKGGFVFGNRELSGVFICRTGDGWSAPGFVTLSTKQYQIGSVEADFVLLLMGKSSTETLSSGKFILGADAVVAAGPVGREVASGDSNIRAQVLTYSRSRDLFAGVDISGGEVNYDGASTSTLYGKDVGIKSILRGEVSAPPGRAREFVKTVGAAATHIRPSEGNGKTQIPLFPWPPPAASATEVIPSAILERNTVLKSLGDVDAKLVSALRGNGYLERSYYAVPDGFALVTRLEQIKADGTSKPPPERWSLESPRAAEFTLSDYLRALLTADPGYFRVIVFIMSDAPFPQAPGQTSYVETIMWLRGGLNVLPMEIANKPYRRTFALTVLIYEFEKDKGKDPKLNQPSRLDAHTHLGKSGIWSDLAFGGNP
jgi:lipid-binding SYLF domain-containing protein